MAKAKTKKIGGPKKGGLTLQDVSEFMIAETASILSDYVQQYIGIATQAPTPGSAIFVNPDRVLKTQTYQETAWYDLYAEVGKDPQIASIVQTRSLAVSGQPWRVEPHNEKVLRERKHAEFATHCLEELENFNQDINELMSGVFFGFAASEVIWKRAKNGTLVPEKILNRPQRRFQFDAVTRAPRLRTKEDPLYGKQLPEKKFIIHRGSTLWENPFGDALYQKLYWMWLFKKTVLSFWMKKNEVDMSCVPLVKVPPGAKQELKDEALSIAQSLRVGAYGYLPSNFEIIWAETKTASTGAAQYDLFVDLCDAQMTKAVLGQTLTTEASGSNGSGSKALGSVHDGVRSDIRDFDSVGIEGTLNSTLVKWIIDVNFGEQEYYPKFRLGNGEIKDAKTDSEVVKNLKSAGFTPTREWISKRFGIELEEEAKAKPEQTQAQAPIDENAATDNKATEEE